MGLGQLGSLYPLHEVGIGDLRAEPEHGGRDLRVKEGFGNLSGMEGEEIEILPSRVNHFFNIRVADQFPKRCERAFGLDGGKIYHSRDVL